jgi:hypothetical protein
LTLFWQVKVGKESMMFRQVALAVAVLGAAYAVTWRLRASRVVSRLPQLPREVVARIFQVYWSGDRYWDTHRQCLRYCISAGDNLDVTCWAFDAFCTTFFDIRYWQSYIWDELRMVVEFETWEENQLGAIAWNTCRPVDDLWYLASGLSPQELVLVLAPPDDDAHWLEWAWYVDVCHELSSIVSYASHVKACYMRPFREAA